MVNCKFMRTKENYTPNDYDMTFPVEEIPSNLDIENVKELTHQIQEKTELGKVIHIKLDEKNNKYVNDINIYTSAHIQIGNTRKEMLLL